MIKKKKCNKYFVLYRRILFTGKTLAPSSSSCSLPDLYILMPKCMHVVCKWLAFNGFVKKIKKSPPRAFRCPVSCSLVGCRSSLMYFSVRTHSHHRIVNRCHHSALWRLCTECKQRTLFCSRLDARMRYFHSNQSVNTHRIHLLALRRIQKSVCCLHSVHNLQNGTTVMRRDREEMNCKKKKSLRTKSILVAS